MRYSGSKQRYVKDLLPILLKGTDNKTMFIDLFMGGANIISNVPLKNKVGFDRNQYIIELWKDIQKNGLHSKCIVASLSENEYKRIKTVYKSGDATDEIKGLIGYVGSSCSYGGAWFNGYARFNEKRKEDHIGEAYNNIKKQIEGFHFLKDTKFFADTYENLFNVIKIPKNHVIYCDPPYASTKKYESDFDNDKFWGWVRHFSKLGYKIFVSEYSAPEDFICIWAKEKKDGMALSNFGDKQNSKIEKLFCYNG